MNERMNYIGKDLFEDKNIKLAKFYWLIQIEKTWLTPPVSWWTCWSGSQGWSRCGRLLGWLGVGMQTVRVAPCLLLDWMFEKEVQVLKCGVFWFEAEEEGWSSADYLNIISRDYGQNSVYIRLPETPRMTIFHRYPGWRGFMWCQANY